MDIREDGNPTMPVLLSFPGRKGKINIAQEIGTTCTTFGTFLLNDVKQVRVTALARQCGNMASEINMAILREWLQGSGVEPVTWGKLVEVLKKCRLNLAEEIESHFKPPRNVPDDPCQKLAEDNSACPEDTDSGSESDPECGFSCACGGCDFATYLEKGCPSSSEDSEFPYLSPQKLSMSELRLFKWKLVKASRKIMRKFAFLENNTVSVLEEKEVSLNEVKNYFLTLSAMHNESVYEDQPRLLQEKAAIEKANDFWSLLFILKGYYSWFSFSIIEDLREDFLFHPGNDQVMNKYKSDFFDYCKRRVFECPRSAVATPHSKGFVSLSLKVDKNFDTFTLNSLKEFEVSISETLGLSKYVLQLCDVTKGCVTVIFKIPSWLGDMITISSEQQQKLVHIGVKQLRVTTRILYEVENYSLSQEQQQAIELIEEQAEMKPGMVTLQEKDVINAIKDVSNWRELGIQLGIKFSKLNEFEQYPVYDRKLKVVEWWMDNDTDCGWRKLIEALNCMGHRQIAWTIRNKYLKKETSSCDYEVDDEVFNNTQLILQGTRAQVTRRRSSSMKLTGTTVAFFDLLTDLIDILEEDQKALPKMKAVLANMVVFLDDDKISAIIASPEYHKANKVSELFAVLAPCWNAFDNDLLQSLIKASGSEEANKKMNKFLASIDPEMPLVERIPSISDLESTSTDSLMEQSPAPYEKMSVEETTDVVVLQIKTDKKQLTLSEMKDIKELFCQKFDLSKECLVFKGTFVWSCTLEFWLSSRLLPFVQSQSLSLSINDIQFLLSHNIRQMSIEDAYCLIVPTAQDLHFLEACLAGDGDTVQSLLELGVDINTKTPDGTTAMQCALKAGHLWIVEMLLAAGAQPDLMVKGGWPLIMRACRRGFPILVENLLAGGVSPNFKTEDGWPALLCACRNGHTKVVEKLLAGGANPDQQTEDGWSPLMTACSKGYPQVVEVLLDGGARPDLQSKSGWTALMSACRNGSPEIVKQMLAAGATPDLQGKDGWSALMAGSRNGNLAAVVELLKAGAQPNLEDENGWIAHMSASQTGHVGVVEALLKAGAKRDHQDIDGWTALMSASQNGHLDVVERLLADGSQPDQQDKTGWTALMSACLNNHPKVVEKLLAEGANPDLRNESGQTALVLAVHCESEEVINLLREASASADIQGKDGVTPLMVAVHHGFSRAVKVLMKAKPDVNLQDEEGGTVLIDACKKEKLNIVKFLLKEGADVNHKTKGEYWQTPLLIVAIKGNAEIMEELLKAKADPNLVSKDGHGLSPLMLASAEGKLDIVELLLQYDADPNLQNPNTGSTPLMLAIEYDRVHVAKKLIGCNVNLHAANKEGKTAADIAHKVNSEVYWELLKRGASLSSLQSKGQKGGESQLVEQLLKALIQRLQKDRQIMKLVVPVQEEDRIPEKKPRLLESSYSSDAVGVYA